MWAEIIFYNFFSFQSIKLFQYKRFIQTACLELNFKHHTHTYVYTSREGMEGHKSHLIKSHHSKHKHSFQLKSLRSSSKKINYKHLTCFHEIGKLKNIIHAQIKTGKISNKVPYYHGILVWLENLFTQTT